MKSVRWILSYVLVASLGLWLAFAVSARFMAPAHSQGTPANGELPAEFMKEVENTQAPPVPPTQPVPPPPVSEIQPVGDGATAQPQGTPIAIIPTDEYRYDPTGKRDPFKAFRNIRPTTQTEAKVNEVLEPLQRWEIERLQVVGILWDVRVPRAMIKDPDGAVIAVTKNSKIGRNEGFVAAIREGEVVVVETRYEEGQPQKNTRVLELKK